ncbi:FAD-dependent oxidoreductase domain-containing protein 2-like [Anneissia japonica]|uniref:FAD-dependent oxidoreductase domain-containing protein 2-like n=1 Tax=Anneissia japonica TaxID=1529436 RepID=UPI0014255181|nr:FAD-dependent oxidoreductase domain-containing protein 2-like [Anneissia japonica]
MKQEVKFVYKNTKMSQLIYGFFIVLLTIHSKCILSVENNNNVIVGHKQYCIVGAGPGGLQMGYFLERAEREYVIFEQKDISGAFFVDYPRHRKLISINKRHTGKTNKEFNFRHDWNSLISDDETLQMRYYSKDFFPQADAYVKYLNDYTRKLQLNVQYNTRISNIRKQTAEDGEEIFLMDGQNGSTFSCKILIMGTGIGTPNNPEFFGMEHTNKYDDMSLDTDDFEGKSVMILGRGNSAFETADHILGSTNVIHMLSRSRVKMAWETHYVGDLRAVNNGILDTYQLKSLDGIIEADVNEVAVLKNEKNGKLIVAIKDELELGFNHSIVNDSFYKSVRNSIPDNFPLRDGYDYVIRCLGFVYDFDIFQPNARPEATTSGKYPAINAAYEVENVSDMFIAGTSSHSLDHKKSAGGFIHGFRYTAQALHHLLEYRYHSIPWPSVHQPITELINHIIKRANEGSGIYQMFSQLGDIIILHNDGLEYEYLEEFPLQMLHRLPESTGRNGSNVIVLSMEYGKDYSGVGNDVFRPNRATGEPSRAHNSNFLHPVLYYYRTLPTEFGMKHAKEKNLILPVPQRIHHIVEDFLTDFSAPLSHILPLRRFLENCVGQDLRYFFDDFCFKSLLMYGNAPLTCHQYYLRGQGLPGTESLMFHKKRLCGQEWQC